MKNNNNESPETVRESSTLKNKYGFRLTIFLTGIIIGVILTVGITVYATGYLASNVTYKNNQTVADALNTLYQNVNESANIKTGEYACQGAKEKKWIELGFKPKYIMVTLENTDSGVNNAIFSYKENVSTTKSYHAKLDNVTIQGYTMEGKNNSITVNNTHIYGVDSTGFGFYFQVANRKIYWAAVK